MKNFFKIIGLLTLVFFSFFYTEKVIEVINEQDEIMINIKNNLNKYNEKSVNATIKDDTIIPGISGREVNVEKSYKAMKKIGTFNEKLLSYNEILPTISIHNNKDKYIIKGNNKYKEISLIFKINDNKNYNKLVQILKNKNIKANLFLSYDYLNQNINNIDKNENFEFYSYGNKGEYKEEIIILSNNIITRKSNNANICLTEKLKNNTLNICSENDLHTIYPTIINGTYQSIKTKIENGSIISFEITENTLTELPIIIDYIESKGYKIDLLSELINENKQNSTQ